MINGNLSLGEKEANFEDEWYIYGHNLKIYYEPEFGQIFLKSNNGEIQTTTEYKQLLSDFLNKLKN